MLAHNLRRPQGTKNAFKRYVKTLFSGCTMPLTVCLRRYGNGIYLTPCSSSTCNIISHPSHTASISHQLQRRMNTSLTFLTVHLCVSCCSIALSWETHSRHIEKHPGLYRYRLNIIRCVAQLAESSSFNRWHVIQVEAEPGPDSDLVNPG